VTGAEKTVISFFMGAGRERQILRGDGNEHSGRCGQIESAGVFGIVSRNDSGWHSFPLEVGDNRAQKVYVSEKVPVELFVRGIEAKTYSVQTQPTVQ
jgi:hypothetical protein